MDIIAAGSAGVQQVVAGFPGLAGKPDEFAGILSPLTLFALSFFWFVPGLKPAIVPDKSD